jgi:calcium-activated chloride channel regulator 3/4
VTSTHPIFGDDLWTQQSAGCGERGDQIFVAERAIRDDFENVEKKLTNEFMKYRYGVFDVNGFDSDAIYPKCSVGGSQLCTDAINIEPSQNRQNSIAESFNKYTPTKQNQLCHRMSRMDVILRNVDFNNTDRNQNFIPPVFNYVRKMSTRYMVIVDDHIDISVRDSYTFLRDAIRKWLEKDLVHHGTEVGIMRMSSNVTKMSDVMKGIAGSDDREGLLSSLPWYIGNKATNARCNLQGVIEKSIAFMKERSKIFGDAISSIVIISPGMYKCSEVEIWFYIVYVVLVIKDQGSGSGYYSRSRSN